MEHTYHVQDEVVRYYRHIPRVPEHFAVLPELLKELDLDEERFVAAFQAFVSIMHGMYRDLEEHPEGYGVPLIDRNAVNENKEDGNLAKASWRSIKRLGDVVAELGRLGQVEGDRLRLPITALKAALKKMAKSALILDRLIDAGFVLEGYGKGTYEKGVETLTLAYPSHPDVALALRAYAISPPFHVDDPHEFYYFDYKRVADRQNLSRHCVAEDLAALLKEDAGKLLVALHRMFVDDLGLTSHYKDETIEYYLKKKRVARFQIDFLSLDVNVILKIKNIDGYIARIEELPTALRAKFERGGCARCGFQGATDEHCKFRILWTLDGKRHEACNFFSFEFRNPASDSAKWLVGLMAAEYRLTAS